MNDIYEYPDVILVPQLQNLSGGAELFSMFQKREWGINRNHRDTYMQTHYQIMNGMIQNIFVQKTGV